jgi:Tol biopolymer transport system component
MKVFSKLIIVMLFIGLPMSDALSAELNKLTGKIAFIRDGEVWVANQQGHDLKQITKTAGKVEDFLFSPSLKYLAYSRIIKYVDEPGLWEPGEKPPKRALCSIVIMDAEKQTILKEIMPPGGGWLYPAKWLPEERILFYESSGFDISAFLEYDLRAGIQKELENQQGSQLFEATFDRNGSHMLYIDDTGVGEAFKQNLHLVELKSKQDKIILSRRSIVEPAISDDNKNVAFIEVESVGKEYFDNLWIYSFKDGSPKEIYRGKARPKAAGINELSWSFDGRYIGMFFSPEALVIDAQKPTDIQKIQGLDFHWVTNKRIVFAQGKNIFSHDLDTKTSEVFIKDGSKPKLLWLRK